METEEKSLIDNFNPIVLKNMILFSIKTKKAYICSEDTLSYEKDSVVYEFIVDFFLDEIKKNIINRPAKKYNELTENLYYVKGKINIKKTVLNLNNKVNCTYGELSLNNKLNQIIKYILFYLIKDEKLNKNKTLRKRLLNTYYYFEEVKLIDITISDVLDIRLNKNNQHYESLLLISRYILGCIKYKNNTKEKYIDIDSKLWWIYQEFIRNYFDYYKKELSIKNVSPSKYEWNLITIDGSNSDYLPKMRTDIEIDTDNQHIIIDAKCYKNSLQEFYDKKIFHSSNLYQIKSYLDIYRMKNNNKMLRGILVYPFNHLSNLNSGNQFYYDQDANYTIEIYNLDFKRSWEEICNDLNNIIYSNNSYNYLLEKNETDLI